MAGMRFLRARCWRLKGLREADIDRFLAAEEEPVYAWREKARKKAQRGSLGNRPGNLLYLPKALYGLSMKAADARNMRSDRWVRETLCKQIAEDLNMPLSGVMAFLPKVDKEAAEDDNA